MKLSYSCENWMKKGIYIIIWGIVIVHKHSFLPYLSNLWDDHSGVVVIYSPPTSEVGGSNPSPYVGKLVVAY